MTSTGPPPESGGPDVGHASTSTRRRRSPVVAVAVVVSLAAAGIALAVAASTGGGPTEVLEVDDRIIEVPGEVEASLERDGQRRSHPVATVEGRPVVVAVEALEPGLDTYLRVYDVDGALVAEDDDGGSGLDSRLVLVPATGGRHVVEVASYQGASSGPYRLRVTPQAAVDPAAQVLDEGGMVVEGDAERSRFPFQAAAGAEVVVLVSPTDGDFDPVVELLGPDGASLGRDDDGGEGRGSRLEVRTTTDGLHVAVVTGFGGDTGDFQISVSVVEPPKRELTPQGQ